jgi:Divergent InlB B-repeat domain
MNDFIAGPASGARQGGTGLGGGGSPPTVLIAALGAAVLIAATLVGLLLSGGGGDTGSSGGPGSDASGLVGTTAGNEKRVVLTVQVDGGGSGRAIIDPSAITCTDTCEHAFVLGERVSLSPDPDTGSRFDGWSDACTGKRRCSLVMDRPREVTVTFEGSPAAAQCSDGRDNDGDGLVDEADPGCDADNTEAPNDRPAPASDCHDGRDNDGDGLVDAAQDPGCASGGSEAGSAGKTTTTTTTAPPPPPPAAPAPQCGDGRDNDGDGLIDAKDPGCASGGTEGGAQGTSECGDGRDNDGDGLVDRPADPGCDADGREAGPR